MVDEDSTGSCRGCAVKLNPTCKSFHAWHTSRREDSRVSEQLVHFLSLLDQDVEVMVRQAPRGRRRGTVRAKDRKAPKTSAWPTTVRQVDVFYQSLPAVHS
jgi:hypothetical protein